MKKNKIIISLSTAISVFFFISSILSFLLLSILIWMTLALKILMLICICYYIFSIIILLILAITKYKNSSIKIFYYILIIFLTTFAIMILELSINIINSNKYTDYYQNCPFYYGLFELNKCQNRRCLSIENNNYICSYNASSGIYSFNYCLHLKTETESGQRADTTNIEDDIICDKAIYKKNHTKVDLFFSECNNTNSDIYYCYRKDSFKTYLSISNDICDSKNICDEKHSILGTIKAGIIISCCLNFILFIILLCKIYQKENRKGSAENHVLIGNVNTVSRNLNSRRNRNRQNESNCSTEGNKNQEDIKDFKIENAKNILVENKEVFVLTSNIMTVSSAGIQNRKGSEEININKIDNENNN